MSPAVETLRALLAGEAGAHRALLPACLAEAFGVEAFGGAMIAELFGRHPQPLSREPHVVETAAGLALFDADADGREQAIVCDLYDGRIGRLWRLGAGEAEPRDETSEPVLAIPAEPFLSQRRPAFALSASDHPELDPAALPALEALGEAVVRDIHATTAQAIAVRAFGQDGRGAALFACPSRPGDLTRRAGLTLAACAFRYDEDGALLHARPVIDATPHRAVLQALWSPPLAPGACA